ncbi:hypothetical protein SESBI_06350 [Sesbania bispinosa]|nr:hypothetical protein SESBI_06350 [Sesbania bispinosa]
MDPNVSEPLILSSMEGLELLLEPDGVQSLRAAQRMLVGRLITDKSPNKMAAKEILTKACSFTEELTITDLGPNVFLFNFKTAKDARRALDGGPWYVMGCLLSLQCWIPEASVHEVNFDFVGFWVQFHGLPLEFMTTSNAVKVAKLLGDIVAIESPFVENHLLRSFLRVRVRINIKKPMVTGFWLPRKDLPKAKSLAAIAAENSNRQRKTKNGEDDDVSQGDKKEMEAREQQEDALGLSPDSRGEGANGNSTNDQHPPKGCQEDNEVREKTQQHTGDSVVPMQEKVSVSNVPSNHAGILQRNFSEDNNSANVNGPRENVVLGPSLGSPTNRRRLPPPSVTRVDLRKGKQRAGLGPECIRDIHIETEFIGLKDDVVILDYPSPQIRGTSKYGLTMTQEEIRRCKASWLLSKLDCGDSEVGEQAMKKKDIDNTKYFVEFPPEEEEESSKDTNVAVSILVEEFKNTMNLKRDRSDSALLITYGDCMEEESDNPPTKRIRAEAKTPGVFP